MSLATIFIVAPLAGAWIEISILTINHLLLSVAPLAGAWIEMNHFQDICPGCMVAPLAGAWIEIYATAVSGLRRRRRSPRGSVD